MVVNIPEFKLRAGDLPEKPTFITSVVVGKAMRTQTPVLEEDMKYIVFWPYWNVPPSILRGEMIPKIAKDREYVQRNGYEIATYDGQMVTDGVVSDDVLARLRAGKLTVRQKPGPKSALGLVKFIFPNDNNVYLHSAPAQSLFSRTRRDFSHGCIRVEDPKALAEWVLRNCSRHTIKVDRFNHKRRTMLSLQSRDNFSITTVKWGSGLSHCEQLDRVGL